MTITEAPARRAPSVAPVESRRRPSWHRWVYGPPDQPRWARPSLWALLVISAFLYFWGLTRNGMANDFYAAAVKSGTENWKALLFGSLDPGNSITVDKPPAAMWVMALSGRLLGFSSFSMLLPEALMGVASVALLYAAVRRWSGPAAGLLAGSVLALTPVAALMFRFDNPDALLVFLLVAAAYCTVRATENGSGRWLALAGVAMGFGFLTKLLQAFLVLPALGLVFLVAAPIALRKRIFKLLGAFVALAISGGWYVALVCLWPSASRPYIGGSTNNSLWELALGYNGLGRVLGGDGNGGGGGNGPGGSAFGGGTGITRLFGESFGTEISWLLPAALIGLIAGLWFTRRTPRTGRTRAALILWGGWTLVTGIVFSYMKGTIHPYYMIALAPGIAALIGISVVELWRGRSNLAARGALGAMLAATGIWDYVLLDRTPHWYPELRWIVLIGSILIASVLIVGAHQLGRLTVAVAAVGLLFGLAGSTAYTIDTVATVHTGSIPTSGPSSGSGMGGFGGGKISIPSGNASGTTGSQAPGTAASSASKTSASASQGGPGGFGQDTSNNTALKNLLNASSSYRWAAATVGSQSAGSLELSTNTSVMAIGGFTGSDNSPTLAQFEKYVSDGDIHYFIASGGHGGLGGDSGVGTQITNWVEQHYKSTTVGGTTVYDLTQPIS